MKPRNPESAGINTPVLRAFAPALACVFLAACGGRVESDFTISTHQLPTPDVPTTVYSLPNFWIEPPINGVSSEVSCEVVTDASVGYDVLGTGESLDGVLNVNEGELRFPATREVCDKLQDNSGSVALSQQHGLVVEVK